MWRSQIFEDCMINCRILNYIGKPLYIVVGKFPILEIIHDYLGLCPTLTPPSQ